MGAATRGVLLELEVSDELEDEGEIRFLPLPPFPLPFFTLLCLPFDPATLPQARGVPLVNHDTAFADLPLFWPFESILPGLQRL